jgi:hypothetical protein
MRIANLWLWAIFWHLAAFSTKHKARNALDTFAIDCSSHLSAKVPQPNFPTLKMIEMRGIRHVASSRALFNHAAALGRDFLVRFVRAGMRGQAHPTMMSALPANASCLRE